MATKIFPTDLDIGGNGEGATYKDVNWHHLFGMVPQGLFRFGGIPFIKQGFNQSSVGLDVTITTGQAVIQGLYVHIDSETILTLEDDIRNLVYLELERDGNNIVLGALIKVTSVVENLPENSMMLFEMNTQSGSVLAVKDRRAYSAQCSFGSYTGDALGSLNFVLGFAPSVVVLTDTSNNGIAVSIRSGNGGGYATANMDPIGPLDYGFSVGVNSNQVNAHYAYAAFG